MVETQPFKCDAENVPHLRIAELEAVYLAADSEAEKAECRERILEIVTRHNKVKTYADLCSKHSWPRDEAVVGRMQAAVDEELCRIDLAASQADANMIESEITDAMVGRAYALTNTGDFAAGREAIAKVTAARIGTGARLDLLMLLARIAMFESDFQEAAAAVARATAELEKGGDWERRNRLKAYDGLLHLSTADFAKAAEVLLSGIATFTATEVVSFEDYIFYSVVAASVALPRATYKEQIVDCPEVKQVASEDPVLAQFSTALYRCQYRELFESIVDVAPRLKRDRYVGQHVSQIVHMLKVKAYAQFLSPLQAVRLDHMSATFGVPQEFLESEVFRGIVSGRLNCKLDAAAGVIISVESDEREAMMEEIVKRSAVLTERVQRLFKALQA